MLARQRRLDAWLLLDQPVERRVPLALGDFSFWRFEIEEARFIAGFGEIRWLPASAFVLA